MTTHHVTLPSDPVRRKEAYRIMLGISKTAAKKLSLECMEQECVRQGYCYYEDEENGNTVS